MCKRFGSPYTGYIVFNFVNVNDEYFRKGFYLGFITRNISGAVNRAKPLLTYLGEMKVNERSVHDKVHEIINHEFESRIIKSSHFDFSA